MFRDYIPVVPEVLFPVERHSVIVIGDVVTHSSHIEFPVAAEVQVVPQFYFTGERSDFLVDASHIGVIDVDMLGWKWRLYVEGTPFGIWLPVGILFVFVHVGVVEVVMFIIVRHYVTEFLDFTRV